MKFSQCCMGAAFHLLHLRFGGVNFILSCSTCYELRHKGKPVLFTSMSCPVIDSTQVHHSEMQVGS